MAIPPSTRGIGAYKVLTGTPRRRPNELGLAFADVISGWTVELWLSGDSGKTVMCELHLVLERSDEGSSVPKAGAIDQLDELDLPALKVRAMKAAQEVLDQGLQAPPHYRLPEYENAKKVLRWSKRQVRMRASGKRLKRDRTWLAMFAAHYVLLTVEAGVVVPRLAEIYRYSPESVRDILKRCRNEGLLTRPSVRGVAGGHLTSLGQRLVHAFEVMV